MENKKIFIVRHGQTNNNLENILQGGTIDADLNETGFKQAKAFFETYKGIPFNKIYTSTLKRSIQFVQPFIEAGVPYEAHSGLNEISYGEKDGLQRGENDSFYEDLVSEWDKGNLHEKFKGGENPLEVQQRQKPVLDLILSRPSEQLILISMHGRAMRILLSSVIDKDVQKMHLYEHENSCLYVLNYSNGSFSIEKSNDVSHLNFAFQQL